jgi:hypothetical protein
MDQITYSSIQNPYKTKTDNTIITQTDTPQTYNPLDKTVPEFRVPVIEYNGFGLTREPQYLLWVVSTLDNSRVPTVLSGRYTNPRLAKEAVDTYLQRKQAQKKKPKAKKEKIADAYDSANYT